MEGFCLSGVCRDATMNKKRNGSSSENKEKEISKGPCLDSEKFDVQVGRAGWPQFSQ